MKPESTIRKLQMPGDGYVQLGDDPTTAAKTSPGSSVLCSPVPSPIDLLTQAFTPVVPLDTEQAMLPSPGYEQVKESAQMWKSYQSQTTGSIWAPLTAGSQRGAIVTLMSLALGTGVLALPYAFSQCGIILGTLTLFLAYTASAISLPIVLMAGRYTECKTYASLVALAAQRRWVSSVLDLAVFIYGFGAIVAGFMFLGDFITDLFAAFPGYQWVTRNHSICGIALVAWPLTMPSDIGFLRYLSAMSPAAICIVAVVTISQAPALFASAQERGLDVTFFHFEPVAWLKAASICIFAFNCHIVALPVGHNLDGPSPRRIVKVAFSACTLEFLLYVLVGTSGYLSFASETQGDFLLNYPQGSVVIWFCRLMLTVVVLVNVVLTCLPTVDCLSELLSKLCDNCLSLVDNLRDERKGGARERSASFGSEGVAPLSWPATVLFKTLNLGAALLVALSCTDASTVISILGGSVASMLMFWLPSIIYLNILWPMQPRIFREFVLGALWFMGSCGFASTVLTILGM
eukprot:TRINITY_DN13208_c0_g1_i1.p1 TRINITY_DN13208_c0_g1~~TRINITY_DN13208_c0_g1_i1.p1  ORF type:complete len:518 (-),score=70.43 TRINITY_DN13208_c0_g1_i1:565-2118(-)